MDGMHPGLPAGFTAFTAAGTPDANGAHSAIPDTLMPYQPLQIWICCLLSGNRLQGTTLRAEVSIDYNSQAAGHVTTAS